MNDCWSYNGNFLDGHYIFVIVDPHNPFFDVSSHIHFDHQNNPIDIRLTKEDKNDQTLNSNIHHDNLALGEDVYFAGTVDFKNGYVDTWTNKSGHYQIEEMHNWQTHSALPLSVDKFKTWEFLKGK